MRNCQIVSLRLSEICQLARRTQKQVWKSERQFALFCFILFPREEELGTMETWTDSRSLAWGSPHAQILSRQGPVLNGLGHGVQASPHKVVGETRNVNYWALFSYQPYLLLCFPSFKENVGDHSLWRLAGWHRRLRARCASLRLVPVGTTYSH